MTTSSKGAGAYRSRPTKRRRRTKADIAAIREQIRACLETCHPMTVRQTFYQLVGRGAIDKTEQEYKGTVVRLLTEMRRSGDIPYGWLSDNTRWMRKPRSYTGLAQCLEDTARTYRRSVWDDQDVYVEIWLEKDALAGVLYDETGRWDVPLMVTRGYPSRTYIYEAAGQIEAEGKPAYLYYFGDLDPSGLDIPRTVEAGVRELAPEAEIHFQRVAVTPEQIEAFGLPTRPTKTTDSRSKGFEGESVEVDAIPPDELRRLVRGCIDQHIDADALDKTKAIEAAERRTLQQVLERFEE